MLVDAALGALIALLVAAVATPVGVSGAVFLVPVQVSLLHVPSPAVTPTNLLYNLIAIPGALAQAWRERRADLGLVRLLTAGTLPGVGGVGDPRGTAGRPGHVLPGDRRVLTPLGAWLAFGRLRARERPAVHRRWIVVLGLVVGTIGGIYGIGGGSILAPVLVALGYAVVEVAPAALVATFLTSIVGIASYGVLSLSGNGDIAPDWLTGVALGLGGLVGGMLGARLQQRLPEAVLRRGLGTLAVVLGVRYSIQGMS